MVSSVLKELVADEHGCELRNASQPSHSDTFFVFEADLLPREHPETIVARVYQCPNFNQLNMTDLNNARDACQKDNIPFLIITNGKTFRTYLVQSRSPEYLPFIPILAGLPRHKRLTLRDLRPFTSISQVRLMATRLGDAIFSKHGHDRLRLFDHLLAIMIAKVYDERNNPKLLRFSPMFLENKEITEVFHRLLQKALQYFKLSDWPTDTLDFDATTLSSCFELLHPYSFTHTIHLSPDAEILGTFYQETVSSTFRGSLGAYFTPKPICELALGVCGLSPTVKTIFDISCGSGTFLLTAYATTLKFNRGTKPEVYGIDIQERMVLTSIFNALIHGVNQPHIIHGDGLKVSLEYWRKSNDYVPPAGFSLIVGNPPFAGYEMEPPDLIRELNRQAIQKGVGARVHKVIPFIMKVTQLLKPGGLAVLLIPVSVLNAEATPFVSLRRWLLEQARVEGIIGLPKDALVHTGTGIETALLVFKRKGGKKSPVTPIFVIQVKNLGFDRRGRPIPGSEIDQVIARFQQRNFSESCWISADLLTKYDRWDPSWLLSWLPKFEEAAKNDFIQLTKIAAVVQRTFKRSDVSSNQKLRYFEVSDVDIDSGKVLSTHEIDGNRFAMKSRLRLLVKADDVLLPNHRDSLLAKTAKGWGRSAVYVSTDEDGCITTDRFTILSPKIEPQLLVAILNSKFVRDQLVIRARGSASFDIREKILSEIWIPKVWLTRNFATDVLELMKERDHLESKLKDVQSQLLILFDQQSSG